jgi:hypothetical protein
MISHHSEPTEFISRLTDRKELAIRSASMWKYGGSVEATVGCKYPGEAGLGSCESISHTDTTREYPLGKMRPTSSLMPRYTTEYTNA